MGRSLKTLWTAFLPNAPYVPPEWSYVVRWRIANKWKQRAFLTMAEAESCLATMRALRDQSAVYRDHDFDEARFVGESNPPRTVTRRRPAGPRTKRFIVRWYLGRKAHGRGFSTRDEATTFHHQLWATEVHTGKLFVSHRIWHRVS